MHNTASQGDNIYNEKIFVTPKKLKTAANENLKQIKITTRTKQKHEYKNCKILLLSKRLEFILLKLQLNSDELIKIIQN